jgi:hypothetical protein
MGRKRPRIQISPHQRAELQRRLRAAKHPRDRERLGTLLDATSGQYTPIRRRARP